MVQTLKDEVRIRIYEAAMEEFFRKDFKTATMRDIASRASIPTGLIYSYYKNKQALFDDIVQSVLIKLPETLKEAEDSYGEPFEKFMNVERQFLISLFDRRREFLILIDKSAGTYHCDAKEIMIGTIESHIKRSLDKKNGKKYDDLFPHILACNFVESFLEIMRHFKSRKWAEEMLDLVAKQFFEGSDSL